MGGEDVRRSAYAKLSYTRSIRGKMITASTNYDVVDAVYCMSLCEFRMGATGLGVVSPTSNGLHMYFDAAYSRTMLRMRLTGHILRGRPGNPVSSTYYDQEIEYNANKIEYRHVRHTFGLRPGDPTIFWGDFISSSKFKRLTFISWNSANPIVVAYPANRISTAQV